MHGALSGTKPDLPNGHDVKGKPATKEKTRTQPRARGTGSPTKQAPMQLAQLGRQWLLLLSNTTNFTKPGTQQLHETRRAGASPDRPPTPPPSADRLALVQELGGALGEAVRRGLQEMARLKKIIKNGHGSNPNRAPSKHPIQSNH